MDIGISEQFKGRYDGYMLLKFTSCQEFQQDFLDGQNCFLIPQIFLHNVIILDVEMRMREILF